MYLILCIERTTLRAQATFPIEWQPLLFISENNLLRLKLHYCVGTLTQRRQRRVFDTVFVPFPLRQHISFIKRRKLAKIEQFTRRKWIRTIALNTFLVA